MGVGFFLAVGEAAADGLGEAEADALGTAGSGSQVGRAASRGGRASSEPPSVVERGQHPGAVPTAATTEAAADHGAAAGGAPALGPARGQSLRT